jgi:hypothetical protein
MFRYAALAILVCSAVVGPAFAQDVSLQWKFKEGEKFYLEEKIQSDVIEKVPKLDKTTIKKQTQQRLSSFLIKSVQPDGTIVMEQRIESWKIKVVGDVPGAADDGGKLLEQLFRDVTFVVRMNKFGKIVKLEGQEKIAQKIRDMKNINQGEADQLKAHATEEILRSPLSIAFDMLPEKAVKKGDKWTRVSEVPVPALGKFTFTTEFTYETRVEAGDVLASKGLFTFQTGKDGQMSPGVKLLKIELAKNQQTGRIVFDGAKGRLVVKETNLPLAISMTVMTQGTELVIEIEANENRTIRLHDTKPVEK